jgi:hypothetical protein
VLLPIFTSTFNSLYTQISAKPYPCSENIKSSKSSTSPQRTTALQSSFINHHHAFLKHPSQHSHPLLSSISRAHEQARLDSEIIQRFLRLCRRSWRCLSRSERQLPRKSYLPPAYQFPTKHLQVDLNDLASVSAADLKIISDAAKVSEQAEVATGGFNDALEGVSGDAATALQNGKIKNKVLKLQTDVLRLQIQAAQGKTGLDAQIAAQQKKLATNVALDVKAAGQASTAIDFAG